MARLIFCSGVWPKRYRIIWDNQDAVIDAIRTIVDDKKARGIEPARAHWRELKEVLTQEQFEEYLPNMVALKIAEPMRTINGDSYIINRPKAIAFRAERNDRNKWPLITSR